MMAGPDSPAGWAAEAPDTPEIPEFRRHVEDSTAWVLDLKARLGWHHTHLAYLALRTTLHALREHLGTDDALYFGLGLPTLLRGDYFEGWHPHKRRHRSQTRQAMLTWIHQGLEQNPAVDPELVARKVFEVISTRLPAAELEQLKAATPKVLGALWPD